MVQSNQDGVPGTSLKQLKNWDKNICSGGSQNIGVGQQGSVTLERKVTDEVSPAIAPTNCLKGLQALVWAVGIRWNLAASLN